MIMTKEEEVSFKKFTSYTCQNIKCTDCNEESFCYLLDESEDENMLPKIIHLITRLIL